MEAFAFPSVDLVSVDAYSSAMRDLIDQGLDQRRCAFVAGDLIAAQLLRYPRVVHRCQYGKSLGNHQS